MNPSLSSMDKNASPALAGILLRLILSCAFWGGTFIAGRYLAQRMPHFTAATLRFTFALLGLVLYMVWTGTRLPKPTGRQLLLTFGLGFSGIFIYNTGFFAGLGLLQASRAALMIAASPVMTFCAVQLIERAHWSWKATLGVMTSFVGAVTVVTHGDLADLLHGAVGLGELWLFVSVCSWVVYTLLIRYRGQGMNALPMTFYATVWGTALLAIPASSEVLSGQVSWPDGYEWGAIAYLGLCGTSLAFVWYNQAVAVVGAARATQFTNLVPLFGVLFSILILGEPLHVSAVVGGVMVIAGVMLANRAKTTKAKHG